MQRLKWSTANIVSQTDERQQDEIYIALEHVESWTGRISESGSDADFDSQVKRFWSGDVLFGKLRPYLAKVTRPDRNGVCVGEFLVLRPHTDNLLPAYLEQLLRSKPIIDAIDASTFGAKMPRADWRFIGNLVLPVPPLAEQAAIVEHLDKATAAIDKAIAGAHRSIELLREYRAPDRGRSHRSTGRARSGGQSARRGGANRLNQSLSLFARRRWYRNPT